MNLFERLDAVADRWNVLRHPFYERWECGALSRAELFDQRDQHYIRR